MTEYKTRKGSNIFVDPITQQTIPFMRHAGDFTYDMSGDDAVAREDVPLIGNWQDYTGSGGVPALAQQTFSAQENTLQGTYPQIKEGVKIPNLSVIGTTEQTHRRRVKKVYVNAGD